jgi:hypothetical protein
MLHAQTLKFNNENQKNKKNQRLVGLIDSQNFEFYPLIKAHVKFLCTGGHLTNPNYQSMNRL